MIRFTLAHQFGNATLESDLRGWMEQVTPTIGDVSKMGDEQIEVSAEEAIAITLIDIRDNLARINQRLARVHPEHEIDW